jgi:solute carrier family 8 (sodium/calcium exchanger)
LDSSKNVRIVIVDDEDYEKKETFQVYLGQPYVVTADGEEPPPSPGGNTPEEERIRELGRPRLGELTVGYFGCLPPF